MIELVLGFNSFGLLPVKRLEYLDWGFLFRLLLLLCWLDGLRKCNSWGLYILDFLNEWFPIGILSCLEPDKLTATLHVFIADSLSLELDLFEFLILFCVVVPFVILLLLIDLQELLSAMTHFIRNLSFFFFFVFSQWLFLLLRRARLAI